jgi:hypothetical protein
MKKFKTEEECYRDLEASLNRRNFPNIDWLWLDERLKVICLAGLIVGGTIYFGVIAPMNEQQKKLECQMRLRPAFDCAVYR